MNEQKADLTVIVLTFNEEKNLDRAIRSVKGWATEVFVVDSFSTDQTVDIALRYTHQNVHVVQNSFENYSQQWNWALERLPVRTQWTMKLDADECATEPFKEEVSKILAQPQVIPSAFVVHWRLIFMGKRLRWGGLYPNGNIRIWKTGAARFSTREVNEHLVVEGPTGQIMAPIEHHDYKELSHWLDRHNRYSSMEARAIAGGNLTGETKPLLFGRPDQRRMWLRRLYRRLPLRNTLYFLYRFLFRLGFLDGKAGFRYSFLHASFMYWIDLKLKEFKRTGVAPEIVWPSRGTPHPKVADSALQRTVSAKPADSTDS